MIYIVSHKRLMPPRLRGYRPIQVGPGEDYPGFIRDNTGDNIADKNASYCELTAMYWMWKNVDEPYKGLDESTRRKVQSVVEEMSQGRTVILVTHDLREAEGYTPVSLQP